MTHDSKNILNALMSGKETLIKNFIKDLCDSTTSNKKLEILENLKQQILEYDLLLQIDNWEN